MNRLIWDSVPYSRTLPCAIQTAHGAYHHREGMILRVTDENGLVGIGEAAPLPGFSRESLQQVMQSWEKLKSAASDLMVPKFPAELPSVLAELDGVLTDVPSLKFAMETALSDIRSRQASQPLGAWLDPGASESVAVNALIDASSGERWLDRARARWTEGFRTYKVKAGVGSPSEDVDRLSVIRDALPDANLRVDVNGAWSPEAFEKIAGALAGVELEFLEQPLAIGHAREARDISSSVGLKLALDEEVVTLHDALHLIDQRLCDVLVVKPMTVGAICGGISLGQRAKEANMSIVFTSMWESDIGIASALHLAAAVNGGTACGFSTAGMIAEGIVKPGLKIESGRLSIPSGAGLGLALDREVLCRI